MMFIACLRIFPVQTMTYAGAQGLANHASAKAK
jgi:hypothetical protein